MDKQTFGALIMKNEQQLYRIAKSILRNDEDCADATQEAVARGFASLHTLKQDRYAQTWLIRILIHECYRISRGRGRTVSLDSEEYVEAPAPESDSDYSDLYEALSRLPADMRIVLELYYFEGYSIREIADILQLAVGTVKSRMSRARDQLKKLITGGSL